jgi:transglutaminase-like putative cysteine protease
VGKETNPVLQAAKIYEWIGYNLPWAGAREYSTLANIPQYVIENGHGDCGQVGLLYITLARSLGIPARWESGWMLHPDEINWHDWCETYFEGVGWIPTDPSFGRSAVGTALNDYYATGIDVYRMATNEGVGDKLSPPKTYIRSETVDFQPGEVEWRKGNLFYDKWDSHLKVNSITKL